MQKSFQDQLKQWKKDHMEVKKPKKKKESKRKSPTKKQENLSDRDLAFLMGTNRKILYRGKGGAYK